MTSDLCSVFQMGTCESGTAERRQGKASEAGGQPTAPADSSADQGDRDREESGPAQQGAAAETPRRAASRGKQP